METKNIFGIVDYIVFVGMLGISGLIGVYFAWKGQKTAADVLVGGKTMSVLPVAASLMATFMSASGLLGVPGEVYLFGTELLISRIVIVMPIITFLTAHFIVPVFYNLGTASSNEYLEKRFKSRSIRAIACLQYCLTMTFSMGISLYAPALALAQVTGLPAWITIWTTGIVVTFYTTIGGMKAVVWSDVFQASIMFIAMIWIVIKGVIDVGGVAQVWKDNLETDRLVFANFDPSPYVRVSFWNNVLRGTIAFIGAYGTNQATIQRYLALPTLRQAKNTLWASLPMFACMSLLTLTISMVIVSFYRTCDPIKTRRIKAADQIFPLFVMDVLGHIPGIPGIFIAGLFSASLSTISSGINSVSAVILEDVFKVFWGKSMTEARSVRIVKITSIIFGILCMCAATVADEMGNIVQASMFVFGLLGAPMFGTFILGLFIPWANWIGALSGLAIGFLFNLWMGFGNIMNRPFLPIKEKDYVNGCEEFYTNITGAPFNLTKHNEFIQTQIERTNDIFPIFRISFMYYMLIGVLVVLFVGTSVSFATGAETIDTIDAKLLVPGVKEAIERKQKRKNKEEIPTLPESIAMLKPIN